MLYRISHTFFIVALLFFAGLEAPAASSKPGAVPQAGASCEQAMTAVDPSATTREGAAGSAGPAKPPIPGARRRAARWQPTASDRVLNQLIAALSGASKVAATDLVNYLELIIARLGESSVVTQQMRGATFSRSKSVTLARSDLVARAVGMLALRLQEQGSLTVGSELALPALNLIRTYNLKRLRRDFKGVEAFIVASMDAVRWPQAGEPLLDAPLLFQRLAEIRFKAPSHWREPALRWLEQHRSSLSVLDRALVVADMQWAGVDIPASKFHQWVLIPARAFKDDPSAPFLMSTISRGMLVQGEHLSPAEFRTQFEALETTLAALGLKANQDYWTQLLFLSAVHRKGLRVAEPFKPIDNPSMGPFFPKDPKKMEKQVKSQLVQVYGEGEVQSYPRNLLEFLPPPDLYVASENLVVQVDDTYRDILEFSQSLGLPLGFEVRHRSEAETVTDELYTALLGLDVVSVSRLQRSQIRSPLEWSLFIETQR